ncbi:MAG: protein kinase [Planctomycetota bacterium]|nr:protein kinase [Planctomycetota bacterium]
MEQDLTQHQSPDDLQKAEKLSREGNQPPSEIPGYSIHSLIGSGAYGEVWSGTDRNTGRKVAIKFYSRRSAVDFSLLSREVEKLASLAADRYVVQLLDVGWDASPPFYVMDFIENGSLEDELRRRGPFGVEEATEMFQEVAIGLMHLHNKGILHCDLKPGNVLLDTEQKPRLADFGQSRLSSEQVPALGTLFYMAPEQANLEAIPDARWDVFALGALMYCMLTGSPPYRSSEVTDSLESAGEIGERLKRYQKALNQSLPPRDHREIAGVDKQLVDIIDRCIAVDPNKRFENVQGILLALRQREEGRARRPLMLLGMIGPVLLLCIMSVFGFVLYSRSVEKAENSLMEKARESNAWAAQFASRTAADEIDHFFESVHRLSKNRVFLETFRDVLGDRELQEMRARLANPNAGKKNRELISAFVENRVRQRLQPLLRSQLGEAGVKDASWFCSDASGTQLAFVSEDNQVGTIGKNYSWRTYFHGGPKDLKEKRDGEVFYTVDSDPAKRDHIRHSHLSAIFISQASQRWKVAFSVPIFEEERFLGIVAATAHCGDFVTFEDREEQYAMLVDVREGPNQGVILGHPYFREYTKSGEKLGAEFLINQKIDIGEIDSRQVFHDPLAKHDARYGGDWIVGVRPIRRALFDGSVDSTEATGLTVLAAEKSQSIMLPVLELERQIVVLAISSVVTVILVGVGLWILAIRSAKESRERVSRAFKTATETATVAKGKKTDA